MGDREIAALLGIPALGDPANLLVGPKPFDCPFPMATRRWDESLDGPGQGGHEAEWTPLVYESGYGLDGTREDPPFIALVLWWSGALVPVAWDHARRIERGGGWMDAAWGSNPKLYQVEGLARKLIEQGALSRIVRLYKAEGEDRLVEVP